MSSTKTFDYSSVDATGKRSKGKIDASNEAAAAQLLRQRGIVPLSIAQSGQGMQKEISIPGMGGNRVTLKDLSIFSRQFATLTASGMSLLRTLSVLEEQTVKRRCARRSATSARTCRPASRSPRRWQARPDLPDPHDRDGPGG